MGEHTGRVMTRAQYDHEVDLGIIGEDEKIELLAGRILDVSPEGSPHVATINAIFMELLRRLDLGRWVIRPGHPIALSDTDEPEPDLCIVPVRADGYYNSHPGPSEIALVIEVAHSSLRRDLVLKAERYALAGITDYWVVDLIEQRTVVHRQPVDGVYTSVAAIPAGDVISPLALPELWLQPHLRIG